MSEPTPDDIENLIALFNQSDWQEMHLKTDTLEVFLSNDPAARAPSASAPAPAVSTAVVAASSGEAVSSVPVAAVIASAGAQEQIVADGMVVVRAPNLGTFYRAPKPGAPAYVEIGQQVSANTEVCLIEVMKLFTPVKAGVAGIIRQVCVDDGDMVEYEQLLVVIEPTD